MISKSLLLLLLVFLVLCSKTNSRPLSETNEIIKTLHDIDILMNGGNDDDDDEDRDEDDDDDDDKIVNPSVRDAINNSTNNATVPTVDSSNNNTQQLNVTVENTKNNVTNDTSLQTQNTELKTETNKDEKINGSSSKETQKLSTRSGGIAPGQRLTSEQQIPPPPPPPEPPATDVDFHKGDKNQNSMHPDIKLEGKKASIKPSSTEMEKGDNAKRKYNSSKGSKSIDNKGTISTGKSSTMEVEDVSFSEKQKQTSDEVTTDEEDPKIKADKKESIDSVNNENVEDAVVENNDEEEEGESGSEEESDSSANFANTEASADEENGESNEQESKKNQNENNGNDDDNDDKVKMFFVSPFEKRDKENDAGITRQILTYPASGHGYKVNHHYGPSHIWNSDYPYFAYGYSWGCGHHNNVNKKSKMPGKKEKSDLICRDYILMPALSKASVISPIDQNNEDEQTGVARQIVSKDIACNDNDPVCAQKQVIGSMAGGSMFGDGMGGLGMGFPGIPGLHTGISGYNLGGGFGERTRHRERSDREMGYGGGYGGGGASGVGGSDVGGFGLQGMHGGFHGHHGRDSLEKDESGEPISHFMEENNADTPILWGGKSRIPISNNKKGDKKETIKRTHKISNSKKRFLDTAGCYNGGGDDLGYSHDSGNCLGNNVYNGNSGVITAPSTYPTNDVALANFANYNNLHKDLLGWGNSNLRQGARFGGWGAGFRQSAYPLGGYSDNDLSNADNTVLGRPGAEAINSDLCNTGSTDGAGYLANQGICDRPVAGTFDRPVSGVFDRPVVGAFDRPVAGPFDRPVAGVSNYGGFVGTQTSQPLLGRFSNYGVGRPYIVRQEGINTPIHRLRESTVLNQGSLAAKSKIKKKKNTENRSKKTSVNGVTRQDIAMPDEQALMDVTKQRQLIGSLGASTLFSDNVGGMGLGHPGVPGMSSGISGIPGEYGGTGGYSHGWDGEGPGLHPTGYNNFGGGYGEHEGSRDFMGQGRARAVSRPGRNEEEIADQKRGSIIDENEVEGVVSEKDVPERDQPEAEEEDQKVFSFSQSHVMETVPAQKMSEIKKLVHEVSNSLARTNEKLKALKKHHTARKEGDKRQITPAHTPVVAEPVGVPDIRYPVPSADRYPLGAGYIWPSANYGHQYGGPYAWSKSSTPKKNNKEKSNSNKKDKKGKTRRSISEKHHDKSKTGTKRQFLEHPSMGGFGGGRRQFSYHGGMPVYGFGMGMPVHSSFSGHSGLYSSSYGGGLGRHRGLMEGGRQLRLSGSEFASPHSMGGYGLGGSGYGSGYGHSVRPFHVASHNYGSFPGSHSGLSGGFGPESSGLFGGRGGMSAIEGSYSRPSMSHLSGGFTNGESLYHTQVPSMSGVTGFSHNGLPNGLMDAGNGPSLEHTGGRLSSFNDLTGGFSGGFSGRHSSFGSPAAELPGPVGGAVNGAVNGEFGRLPSMGSALPGASIGGDISGNMLAPTQGAGMSSSVSGLSGMPSSPAAGGFDGGNDGMPGLSRQNIAQEDQDPSQTSQFMGMGRSQMPDQMQSMIPESQQAMFAPNQGMTPYGSDLRAMEFAGSKKSEVPKVKDKNVKKE